MEKGESVHKLWSLVSFSYNVKLKWSLCHWISFNEGNAHANVQNILETKVGEIQMLIFYFEIYFHFLGNSYFSHTEKSQVV